MGFVIRRNFSVEPPAATELAGYVPSVGAVLAVTLTVSVALAVADWLSVTVKVKLAFVAVHEATTLAVTAPAASTLMPETVTPLTVALAPPLTVTASVLAA